MKGIFYVLRFHGLALAISLTVIVFGVWGLLAYIPPAASDQDVVLKAPAEVLTVKFVLFSLVAGGVVGLLRLVSLAVRWETLFNNENGPDQH